MDASGSPFTLAASAWTKMIERAKAKKEERFGPQAREGMRAYCGPYDWMFKNVSSDVWFRMPTTYGGTGSEVVVCVNKVAELVEIFGPNLYQRNPTRRATTRQIPKIDPNLFVTDPVKLQQVQAIYQASMMEQQVDRAMGQLFEALLNVTPYKNDLKEHSRWAIDEALIKGLGTLWHDVIDTPYTPVRKVSGSFWRSVDDLLLDPDATSIKSIRWCARGTWMQTWEAERKWNLPPRTIAGSQYAPNTIAGTDAMSPNINYQRRPDLVRVWEVWSKMGVGGRLPYMDGCPDYARVAYEQMGDFCYLVIVENHPWPLNLPPWMFVDANQDRWMHAKAAVQWPTPYWVDNGGWPFTPIYFHTIPGDPWPMSHLTPAMGYLKFLNWAYAKMASKIAVTSRDIIFILDEISDEAKQTIKYGPDLSVVPMAGLGGKTIQEYVQQLQHAPWNEDFWKVIVAVENAFADATGLTELVYGQSARQMRSAVEADRKFDQVNVRPDDMATKVEDAMSMASDREKWASRWHYSPDDVHSLIGIAGAYAWQELVLSQPPERVLDLQMRVESDSSRKPNRTAITDALSQAMPYLGTPLFQAAQAGMLDPFNNLIGDFLESIGIPDKDRYLLVTPPNVPIPEDPNQTAASQAKVEAARAKGSA